MTYIYKNQIDLIEYIYKKSNVDYPTNNYYLFCDYLNIGCYETSHNSSIYSAGKHFIFLNQKESGYRKWEMFGHELGHIMLHAGQQSKLHQAMIQKQEIEADRFSLYFCIPSFLLNSIRLDNHIGYAAEQVSEIFGVTLPFAHQRLELFIKDKERSEQYVLQKT